MTTLIGTSTNLVVQAQVEKLRPDLHLTFFGVTPIGLPVAILGVAFIVATGLALGPQIIELGSKSKEELGLVAD